MKSNLSSDIRITAFLVAIIGLFFATLPLSAADYTYTEIIPPNWLWSSCRAAINDSGVVAGWGYDGTSWKAFTYYQGTYQIITQAGWNAIYPLSMNNNGTIVGEAQPAGSLAFRAVIYSEGVLTDLTPTGVSQARLVDINDNGDMIGNTYTDPIGFLYSDGVYTQLLPPGWTGSIVHAISNDGTVIGRNLANNKQFLYKNGTYIHYN